MLSTGASTSCAARAILSEISFVARVVDAFGPGSRFRDSSYAARFAPRTSVDSFRRPRRPTDKPPSIRYDGETFTSFACPRGFDRGIERQKVGLRRYVADQLTSLSDLTRRLPASRSGHPHSKPARQHRSRPNSYPAFRLRPSR